MHSNTIHSNHSRTLIFMVSAYSLNLSKEIFVWSGEIMVTYFYAAKNENTFGMYIDNVECLNLEKEWGLKNQNASVIIVMKVFLLRVRQWGERIIFPSLWWKHIRDNLFPSNSNEVAAVWIQWCDKKQWVSVQVPLSCVLWVGNRVVLECEVDHYKEEKWWKGFSS